MALNLGSTLIGDIYLGSTQIAQAYLGSTLVYTMSGPAPVTLIPGLIEAFTGSSIPSGYLLCDGSAVSRTTYATLYDVIGDTFGPGDGSTTFNLPNLSGRVPLGVSQTYTLGTSGGAESVTLIESELASHVHEVPQHGHADTIGATTPAFSHSITQPAFKYDKPTTANGAAFGSTSKWTKSVNNTRATISQNVVVADHAAANCTMGGSITNKASFNTESTGGSSAHNNMQPYTTIMYIICTGVSQ